MEYRKRITRCITVTGPRQMVRMRRNAYIILYNVFYISPIRSSVDLNVTAYALSPSRQLITKQRLFQHSYVPDQVIYVTVSTSATSQGHASSPIEKSCTYSNLRYLRESLKQVTVDFARSSAVWCRCTTSHSCCL